MVNKLEEGSYVYENDSYRCKKCDYMTKYPCLLVSHLRRKTPCQKETEKKFIFKKGRFLVKFE